LYHYILGKICVRGSKLSNFKIREQNYKKLKIADQNSKFEAKGQTALKTQNAKCQTKTSLCMDTNLLICECNGLN
jgi:hypothetical protein